MFFSILSTIAKYFGYLLAALAAYVILLPIYQLSHYQVRKHIYQRNNPNVRLGVAWTHYSFPFGFPLFIECVRDAVSRKAFEGFWRRARNAKFRMTFRQQSPGEFVFFTYDPENIRAILATQFKEYGLGFRYGAFKPLLGDGIFTLDGNGWHHSRAMLRPQFTRQQISHMDIIEIHLSKMLKLIRDNNNWPLNKKTLDLQELFFTLSVDVSTDFLFGESVDFFGGGNPKIANAKEFNDSFTNAMAFTANRVRAQALYRLFDGRDYRRWCKISKDFTDSFVQIALKKHQENIALEEKGIKPQESDRYIFINELVKETQDPIILRDQSLNILLAGRDTTASILSWVFYSLSQDKRVFNKLRQEILNDFGPGPSLDDTPEVAASKLKNITFESLKRCVYLRYVLNETLRLYPVIPVNMRSTLQDTTLPRGGRGGAIDPATGKYLDENDGSLPVFVPKGTSVFYSVLLMQQHPRVWGAGVDSDGVPIVSKSYEETTQDEENGIPPVKGFDAWMEHDDARKFRPERWGEPRRSPAKSSTDAPLEEGVSSAKNVGWDFLPFNGGPRICLGQQLALNEMSYAVVRMMQTFSDIHPEFETRDKETQLTLSINKGLPMTFSLV